MKPENIEKLKALYPLYEYYKTNHCLPPVNMATLGRIDLIYHDEFPGKPLSRLYCGPCVEELFQNIFQLYEKSTK